MYDHWNSKDVPYKGRILVDVIDVRGDVQQVDITDYETSHAN
jgi:hypothetical protein